MQKASPRIWTLVAVSISFDDNRKLRAFPLAVDAQIYRSRDLHDAY